MEMHETKIGRLVHKIEKLKTLGERSPGVEFMRSEVYSGDHGLAVIEHAPFGVIGAIANPQLSIISGGQVTNETGIGVDSGGGSSVGASTGGDQSAALLQ